MTATPIREHRLVREGEFDITVTVGDLHGKTVADIRSDIYNGTGDYREFPQQAAMSGLLQTVRSQAMTGVEVENSAYIDALAVAVGLINAKYGGSNGARDENYAHFCANIKELMAMEKKYNAWRHRTMTFLLGNLAPRIAKISARPFFGGDSIDLQRQIAYRITCLTKVIQFSVSHCQKVHDQVDTIITTPMMVEMLVEDVVKIEELMTWEDSHPGYKHAERSAWITARDQRDDRRKMLYRRRLDRKVRKLEQATQEVQGGLETV